MMETWRRRREPQADAGRLRAVLGEPRPKEDVIRCGGCRRRPYQIEEYLDATPALREPALEKDRGRILALVPRLVDQWVRGNEGTFNAETNRFLCSECYVRAGMPVGPNGTRWTCP